MTSGQLQPELEGPNLRGEGRGGVKSTKNFFLELNSAGEKGGIYALKRKGHTDRIRRLEGKRVSLDDESREQGFRAAHSAANPKKLGQR